MGSNAVVMDRGELVANAQAQFAAASVMVEYHEKQARPWGDDLPEAMRQRLDQVRGQRDEARALWLRLASEELGG